ncbi:hypothetical protein BLNAU_9063 [Blattamonas nauphoetae]|uniref:Uncharacterized protein n=1 Tax=Blattamonas nauphoetae TaxID=2049346 RepID=A0ABQ9XWQ6_9EUKA|nr:hypothetical protein BLNAU_9063 [Blattamonas nauphoetae]
MTTSSTGKSDETLIPLGTTFSGSIECDESYIDHIALSEEIRNTSLSSFFQEFVRGKDNLPWTRLMEWFVEAAIGVELFRKHNRSAPPLSFENIRIDGSSTILIDPSSTEREPQSNVGSLTSDFSTISSFFLDIHRTLDQTKRLILPLDYNNQALVYSRIMVALLEHFIASGDLILPDSSPHDHFQYFLDFYHRSFQMNPRTLFYLTKPLAGVFCHTVLSPSKSNCFVPTPHSFLRGSDVERSEKLLIAVEKVQETHSLKIVQNLHFDWKEWVTMMEMVEKGVTALTDLSFLQSRCFRPTLEALQAKHQNRANPPRIEENSRAESSSEELHANQSRHPFLFAGSLHSSSTISTETRLPSQHSSFSSDTQLLSSPQPARPNPHTSRDVSILHSREVLTVIHSLLSKPQIDSFPWKLRSKLTSEKEVELALTLSTIPVSLDERFGPSIFSEQDDNTLVQSLNRCLKVIRTTQSLQCIDDLDSFFAIIVTGLHNSNEFIATFNFTIFIEILNFNSILDPRADQFRTLRSAFRDGTWREQMALLFLWRTWLSKRAQGAPGRDMCVTDFTFDGFMTTDMTDGQLFDEACRFILVLFSSTNASMTGQWKLNFILQFEQRHCMMDRLADKPGTRLGGLKSNLHLAIEHIYIAEVMSLYHGYDFPSELTQLITIDLTNNPHLFSPAPNPALFLNHTSIAPKHRLSFFPMDLIFERFLRNNPTAFFQNFQPPPTAFSQKKFLSTPLVGLHSLLVRCIRVHFNERTLTVFMDILGYLADQQVTSDDFHQLYSSFPPPRLLDLLLSSPHLVKVQKDLWTKFLFILWSLCGIVAPFGASSSLARVFKMLTPFDSNPDDREVTLLRFVGDLVVSLHWLNIPAHFDSPLLCHLPSLASAQRGVLQTLSSHSGIISLVTPLTAQLFVECIALFTKQFDGTNRFLAHLSLLVRSLHSKGIHPVLTTLHHLRSLSRLPVPAIVSAALEFFHRFVSFSSDAVRMKLVKQNLLDHVVFAVSCSSFLDDYKNDQRNQSIFSPSFLHIDIGKNYPSDTEIKHFLTSLTDFVRENHDLPPHVVDLAADQLMQLQCHDFWDFNDESKPHLLHFVPIQTGAPLTFDDSTWFVLLSAHQPRLSSALLGILEAEIRYSSDSSVELALKSGFIAEFLSALDVQTLLATDLSHPLHAALFSFLVALVRAMEYVHKSEYTESRKTCVWSPIRLLFTPLRDYLILHLTAPYPLPCKPSQPRTWRHGHAVLPSPLDELSIQNMLYPVLSLFRTAFEIAEEKEALSQFLPELLVSVWEERRKRGLVAAECAPLFMSTPLHPRLLPDNLKTVIDSASSLLESPSPLSHSDAVDVAAFLMCFRDVFFTRQSEENKKWLRFTMNYRRYLSPPLMSSIAKLLILSALSRNDEVRFESFSLWGFIFQCREANMKFVMTQPSLMKHLIDIVSELSLPRSDFDRRTLNQLFGTVANNCIIVMMHLSQSALKSRDDDTLESNLKERILVPTRDFLVAWAKSSSAALLQSDTLQHLASRPHLERFVSGVWEEVRTEAIRQICPDGNVSEAPSFLTVELFSPMSAERMISPLSSLSLYLSTSPFPPQPVLSSIHLLLRRLERHRPSVFSNTSPRLCDWITSNSRFAECFVEAITTIFLVDDTVLHAEAVSIVSSLISGRDAVPHALVQANVFQHFWVVLEKLTTSQRWKGTDRSDLYNTSHLHRLLLFSISACFKNRIISNDTDLLQKVLIPCQPFIKSFLSAVLYDENKLRSRTIGLLVNVGKTESFFPLLSDIVETSGFHLVTMSLCDTTVRQANYRDERSALLSTFNWPHPNHQRTLRTMMKGRNEEGHEDLIVQAIALLFYRRQNRVNPSPMLGIVNTMGMNVLGQ